MEDASLDIEKRLAALPEDVRQAVLSVEWEGKVQQLGAKEGLHIDQVGALGDMTLMAMLGMFEMPEFPQRVAQALNVPPEKAAKLAEAVTNDVFMPIRASMRAMGDKKSQPQAAPAAMASAPIPSPAPAAPPKPDFSKADSLLSAKVVVTAPSAPAPKPVAPTPPPAPQAPKAPAAPAAPIALAAPAAPAATPLAPAATAPTKPEPLGRSPATGEAPKPGAYTNDPYREPPV